MMVETTWAGSNKLMFGSTECHENVEDFESREELTQAYEVVVSYCTALQQRQSDLCDACKVFKRKRRLLKESNSELLWNHILRPSKNEFFDMPQLNTSIVETDSRLGQYKFGARLGIGSSAVVIECTDEETGELFALKIVDKSKVTQYSTLKHLHNEIVLTTEINHPNVATLVDAIHTDTNLYLVLEHCGVDLFSYFSQAPRLEPALIRSITRQLVAGIQVLELRGIVHHDIKPENILVDEKGGAGAGQDGAATCAKTHLHLRISDFGMAEQYEPGELCSIFCGSPGFVAPEKARSSSRTYDPFKVDIWSIGCVVLEMVMGRRWFSRYWLSISSNLKTPDIFLKATKTQVEGLKPVLDSAGVNETAADFIIRCLAFNPEDRPTVNDIAGHPYITGGCEDDLASSLKTVYLSAPSDEAANNASHELIGPSRYKGETTNCDHQQKTPPMPSTPATPASLRTPKEVANYKAATAYPDRRQRRIDEVGSGITISAAMSKLVSHSKSMEGSLSADEYVDVQAVCNATKRVCEIAVHALENASAKRGFSHAEIRDQLHRLQELDGAAEKFLDASSLAK